METVGRDRKWKLTGFLITKHRIGTLAKVTLGQQTDLPAQQAGRHNDTL